MRFPRLAALILLVFSAPALSAQSYIGSSGLPYSYTSTRISSGPQNLYIPPIANAPFSAVVLLGTSNPSRSYEVVARDSAGRVFEEVYSDIAVAVCSYQEPSGCNQPAQPWVTDRIYIDPVQHTAYDCISDKSHLCHAVSYPGQASGSPANPALTTGTMVKPLGQKKIDGVTAIGSRQSDTARPLGHGRSAAKDRKYTTEIWYSPDLQIELKAKLSFPGASQSLEVKSLKRSEPDAKLFVLPVNYQLTASPPPPPPEDPDEQAIRKTIQSLNQKSH